MDAIIRKVGDDWVLYSEHKTDDGKRRRLGTHSSKRSAEKQEEAIKSREAGR